MTSSLGILAGIAAATIWGLNPLFFSQLLHVPPVELLCHRVLWGALFVLGWCAATGRLPRLAAAFGERGQVLRLALSAGLVTINWLVFLLAVQAGRVSEAGLGYYLFPLASVALGVLVLGERLSPRQWTAVGLAALAVAVLLGGMLLGGEGRGPLVPVVLAVSLGLYGLVRKRIAAGAITGFAVEVSLLAPLAIGWLLLAHTGRAPDFGTQPGGVFGSDLQTTLLLVIAGPITGLPLILFAEAARRLPYATAGLVQYLNPTLQVGSAVLILGESVSTAYGLALVLVWIGLALYSSSLIRRSQRPAG